MATELIINASLPEIRIVLQEDGEIQELLVERPSDKGIVGNIYKGRVTRVLPGMQAAFVDIGLDKAAFLYVDDVYLAPKGFHDEGSSEGSEGEELSGESDIHVPAPAEGEIETSESAGEEGIEPLETSESETDESAQGGDSEDEPVGMGEDPDQADPQPDGTVGPEVEGPRLQSKRGAGPRRGRRGGSGRFRRNRNPADLAADRGPRANPAIPQVGPAAPPAPSLEAVPENYLAQIGDEGNLESDRTALSLAEEGIATTTVTVSPRTELERKSLDSTGNRQQKREFREPRGRDRRIKSKSHRGFRDQINIQDLLKEGQEVIVQVAKEPIAAKGARLTCHISLPGRHLVCMPTIDHVGVSRRIERDDERRRFRDFVDRNRPTKMGFIVRTASSGKSPEVSIRQDIDYLAGLWNDIFEKSKSVTAPALIYEDLNPILRAIRDWVNEEIDKIIVDSRYHYNEVKEFVGRFMPALQPKVELYHGDIPIFDAYGISTELHRALERKVWLKSGGYIVIDQAEALVAIDVNTGRYVGKKNLEDTILKTNLEAVQEIAYQLRLRNCGGIIILDLIDMENDENRLRVYRALDEALKKDRARPTILKISELGLVEMTRKRTRDTIVRTLCEPCQHCESKGFVKSKQTVAYELMREIEREGNDRDTRKILIQAHPKVIDVLAIDERETLDALEKRYRKQIYLQAVMDYHPEQYEVSSDKSPVRQTPESKFNARERDTDDRRPRHRGFDRARGQKDRGGRDSARGGDEAPAGTPVLPVPRAEVKPVVVVASAMELPKPLPVQALQESDPDAIGNRVDANRREGDSQTASLGDTQMGIPGNELAVPKRRPEEDFNEEDRLAYLRAQAAQDAALSNVGSRESAAANGFRNHGGRGGHGGSAGGGRAFGGGGKNRGRGGRNRFRGGQGGRFRPQPHRGMNGGGTHYNQGQAAAPAEPVEREPTSSDSDTSSTE